MEDNTRLTQFKKIVDGMIAVNAGAYRDQYSYRRNRERLKEYTLEEIQQIINSGSLPEQQKLSRNYFYKDGFYRRILIYYATLLKYYGILIPNVASGKSLETEAIKRRYLRAIDYIEIMDLPNLLSNCAIKTLMNGTYYGLIIEETKNNFTVLDLPPYFCSTRFKDFYGNSIIEFDLRYFDSILLEKDREKALEVYPKEIAREYKKYHNGKRVNPWMFIDTAISICFDFFDSRPMFLNVIPATIQYDEAVDTERERDLDEIKKIIVQTIPHNANNEFLLEPDEVEELHRGAVQMLRNNKNVSVLTSYADVEAIQSKGSSDTNINIIDKMSQNIYNESGTSSQLFASTSNLALEYSLSNDLSLMMVLVNKFNVFVTNIINRNFSNSNIKFRYSILPITYYNDKNYIDKTLSLAQNGYSFLLPAIASGFTQKEIGDVKDLENNILKLGEKLIPLSTSYTQSNNSGEANTSSGKVGAPEKPLEEKSPKTIQNEESLDRQGESTNG